MDKTSAENDNEGRKGRPFGADYRMTEESGHVDRKARPDQEGQRLMAAADNRTVLPFGAAMPEQTSRIDYRARPDLIRGRLEDADFSASPDDEEHDAV